MKSQVDAGYAGLAKEFPDQVTAPPKKPKDAASDGDKRAWHEARRRQSSARICVEHTNAELRQKRIWRSPASSPTGPHGAPPDVRQAPNSSSSATAPVDHTPAEPPGHHAPTSIFPEVVRAAP